MEKMTLEDIETLKDGEMIDGVAYRGIARTSMDIQKFSDGSYSMFHGLDGRHPTYKSLEEFKKKEARFFDWVAKGLIFKDK